MSPLGRQCRSTAGRKPGLRHDSGDQFRRFRRHRKPIGGSGQIGLPAGRAAADPAGAAGGAVRLQRRLPRALAGRRAAVAGAAARPRHRQHPVRDRAQGRPRQQHQALLRALPHRGLAGGRERLHPRVFGRGAAGADPVPGRHAGRHARLVSLCGEVPAAAQLPADLRHGGAADPAVPRHLSRHRLRHPRGASSPSAITPPTASACSSTTRTASSSRATSAMSGCTAPPATSSGSTRPRAPPQIALPDEAPADRRALCLHRRADHDAEQVLEQPGRLARDRCAS